MIGSLVLGEDLDAVEEEIVVEVLVEVKQHLHKNIPHIDKFHFLDPEGSFPFRDPSCQGIVIVVTHTFERKE